MNIWKMSVSISLGILLLIPSLAALHILIPAYAQVTFFTSNSNFSSSLPAGTNTKTIDFDNISESTDITASEIGGVTFELLNQGCGTAGTTYGDSEYLCGPQTSAPLIVVKASATTPTVFPSTSNPNVLSPGGASNLPCQTPTTENDDLKLTFDQPTSAVGLDIIFESVDGESYLGVRFLDTNGDLLLQNNFIPIPNVGLGVPGVQFIGLISDTPNIASVEIDEYDENCINPDDHVAYDSIVFVSANESPNCNSASPSVNYLWPPNHKMKSVTVAGITDLEGNPITITIDSIFQDEHVDAAGNGDGNTSPDGSGVGTSAAEIRAERSAGGDGRVYHISFTASDGIGGSCFGEVQVSVPHDKRNRVTVDGGALFDSTST